MKRTWTVTLVVTAAMGYLLAIGLAVVLIAREPTPTVNGQPAPPPPSSPPPPPPIPSPNICRDLPDGVHIDNPANCRAYWVCHSGEAIASICLEGWNFNPVIGLCQLASVFPCTDQLTATTTTEPATTLDVPAADCPATGIAVFPWPGSCSSYRLCFMGRASIRQCAPNMLYDPHQMRCNFRWMVDCEDACPAVSDPLVVVWLPSRHRCDQYFICYNGETMPFECAPGLHWNQAMENCDLPTNVNCAIPNDRRIE